MIGAPLDRSRSLLAQEHPIRVVGSAHAAAAYYYMPPAPEAPRDDSLRTEEFDALVRALLPTVQVREPELTSIEALREAARLAEAHMRRVEWISWGPPRL